jgi:hypothetical protein
MKTKEYAKPLKEERIGYILARFEGETWLSAALRQALKADAEFEKKHAINLVGVNYVNEVKRSYDQYITHGAIEEKAAWCACYDWDCLTPIDLDDANTTLNKVVKK